ncbi:DUF7545 family protein [Halapricum desulfuricans]|uniref:Uncharacterized protein n=1 Tax=Halapricum desulfuricans TaxID=2841257 RepID=A0A897NDW5_9EURY|nr:hypothetical protein [Halapricum desulfuricans]QSG09635.1 Uncharacterized protein HSR122_2255 [Halapricum desulfuricans]QSG11264.1 Uncharacterized protein HSBGL_0833 [Halapricum desulfuricans]
MAEETVTLTIEDDDTTDELTVPIAMIEMLREEEGETPAEIIGDIAMFGLAQRIHGAIHHGQGEPPQEVKDAEELTMELFEERFGASYGELTGHDH